jgi:DNA-binding IclR family transcriptional regulator
MEQRSGVGVLDKAALVLTAVERAPASLNELAARTGLTRATAHRLATALETHRLLSRDAAGRFTPGPRLAAGAPQPPALPWKLLAAAGGELAALRDATGESTQLYARRGQARICVAAAERASGLRDTVPVGAVLPMTAGSAAHVLVAFAEPPGELPPGAAFDAATLHLVRERGWAESVGEREPGLASVSAPVRDRNGRLIAALSLSGPSQRLTRTPGSRYGPALVDAAGRLSGHG